jgi:putative membrane protein
MSDYSGLQGGMTMHTERERILYRAEFDEKWKTYWFLQIVIIFLATVVGIVLIPFWLLGWGVWYCRRYFDNLNCFLGERSLMVGRGVLFRVEKTIPLDKIQDMTLREGPLLKYFGLLQLQIETAGQGSAQGTSEAKLIGIKNARDFRDRVLDQRDALVAGVTAPVAVAAPAAGVGGQGTAEPQAISTTEQLIQLAEKNNRVLQEILAELRAR